MIIRKSRESWGTMIWEYFRSEGATITAIVAVLGLLIAVILGAYSIRSATRTFQSETTKYLDQQMTALLVLANKFQHPALLPYWKSNPVDPEGAAALRLHEALTELNAYNLSYRKLSFSSIDGHLQNLDAASHALYQTAIYPSKVETANREQFGGGFAQEWQGAWAEVSSLLNGLGVSSQFINRAASYSADTYPSTEAVGGMQLADEVFNFAKSEALLAYRALDPVFTFRARLRRKRETERPKADPNGH